MKVDRFPFTHHEQIILYPLRFRVKAGPKMYILYYTVRKITKKSFQNWIIPKQVWFLVRSWWGPKLWYILFISDEAPSREMLWEVKPSTQSLLLWFWWNKTSTTFSSKSLTTVLDELLQFETGIKFIQTQILWYIFPLFGSFLALPTSPILSIIFRLHFSEKKDGQHLDGGWTHHQPCADGKLQGRVSRSRRIQAHLFEGQNVGSSWHRTTFSSRNEGKLI